MEREYEFIAHAARRFGKLVIHVPADIGRELCGRVVQVEAGGVRWVGRVTRTSNVHQVIIPKPLRRHFREGQILRVRLQVKEGVGGGNEDWVRVGSPPANTWPYHR